MTSFTGVAQEACNFKLDPCTTLKSLDQSTPYQEWIGPAGDAFASFYRFVTHYLVRFHNLADFKISNHGRDITCFPLEQISSETIAHLYLNQILPLSLSHQGKLILHGSSVSIDDEAIAFLAPSKSGKSTLAAAFCNTGHKLITDDGLFLQETANRLYVQPSHPSIRLWKDSMSALIADDSAITSYSGHNAKTCIVGGEMLNFCDSPLPVKALYVLGTLDDEGFSIERIHRADAIIELIRNCFILDTDEKSFLTRNFNQLTWLYHNIPIYRLNYTREYRLLPEVITHVIQHARLLNSAAQTKVHGVGSGL